MTVLAVGQPYIPGRTAYPEVVQYNFRGGQHELLMWLKSPSEREVQDVAGGEAGFALYVEPPLLVLLYRFGQAVKWSDAPFTLHLVPDDERVLPEPAEIAEPHALLMVILVDAATGLVRALRAVTFTPAFTAALVLAIRDQAAQPWDAPAYDAALRRLYQRFPTTPNLLRAAQHRTVGGR